MTYNYNTIGNRLSDQITRMENYILELVKDEGLYNLKKEGYDPKEHVELMHEFEKINEELRSTRFLSRYNPFNKYVRELAKIEKELQKKLEPYNKFVLTDYIKTECERLSEEAKDKKSYLGERKKPRDKPSTLKKIGAVVGMGLIGAGIFYMGFAENCGHQSKIKYEDVCTDMKKIKNTLHEKNFSYSFDNLTDNVNLCEIISGNFKITGKSSSNITITIDDARIPKNIQTYKALADLGSELKDDKENISQLNCYKFLTGKKENYPIEVAIPVMDHPNDIIPPSELIKSKSGDCEDYSLLYASYFNAKHIPAFIVINEGHAVAAVGDIPSDSDELKEYIKENKTFIVGSSEYLKRHNFNHSIATKSASTEDILNNLRVNYLSTNIHAIISKENIWLKGGVYCFKVPWSKTLEKEYAKSAADYLNMNISKDEIDKMAENFDDFYKRLVSKAIKVQINNKVNFYWKIKDVLADPSEEKIAADLFNDTVLLK